MTVLNRHWTHGRSRSIFAAQMFCEKTPNDGFCPIFGLEKHMKKKVLLIFAVVTIFLLSGCAAQDWINEQLKNIYPDEGGTVEQSAANEKPNVINAGVYDFDTFNPLATQSESVKEAMQMVYESLFALDSQMKTVPVLAKNVVVSADGKTIDINLKDNVKWHDGSAFTSQDVAYTIKLLRENTTDYSGLIDNIADYNMMGNYSLRIALRNSVPCYEAMLTFPIVKYGTQLAVDANYVPNGTGPFCYGTKSKTDTYYFGAFESYHDGRTQIDALNVIMLSDREEYINMLEASEIDFSSSNIVDLTQYMPKGKLNTYSCVDNDMVFLGFNTADPVFSGSLTRKGISSLISRTDLVETVIFSQGIASRIPINPSSYLYYDTQTDFEADDSAANDYLGDDGWGTNADGKLVRTVNGDEQILEGELLVNSDNGEHINAARMIAKKLNEFGVSAEVVELPYGQYIQRINSGNYDMFVGETRIDNNMDLTILTSFNNNYFRYGNQTVETLCAQLGMTRNEDEVKKLFRQYGETITNDMPFATLYFKNSTLLASTNVISGISPSVSSLYNNCSKWSVK